MGVYDVYGQNRKEKREKQKQKRRVRVLDFVIVIVEIGVERENKKVREQIFEWTNKTTTLRPPTLRFSYKSTHTNQITNNVNKNQCKAPKKKIK